LVDTRFPLSLADGSPPVDVHLSCTPRGLGARTATLTLTTNDLARTTVVYNLACNGRVAPPALSFFTVVPCRVVDTRSMGQPVVAGVDRTFTIAGSCGVPPTARAVSLNVTVSKPTSSGHVVLFPAGSAVPKVSTVNYSSDETRANNAVVAVADDGRLSVHVEPFGSSVHVILDVNGYFE